MIRRWRNARKKRELIKPSEDAELSTENHFIELRNSSFIITVPLSCIVFCYYCYYVAAVIDEAWEP